MIYHNRPRLRCASCLNMMLFEKKPNATLHKQNVNASSNPTVHASAYGVRFKSRRALPTYVLRFNLSCNSNTV